jgi:hypothetical protein
MAIGFTPPTIKWKASVHWQFNWHVSSLVHFNQIQKAWGDSWEALSGFRNKLLRLEKNLFVAWNIVETFFPCQRLLTQKLHWSVH